MSRVLVPVPSPCLDCPLTPSSSTIPLFHSPSLPSPSPFHSFLILFRALFLCFPLALSVPSLLISICDRTVFFLFCSFFSGSLGPLPIVGPILGAIDKMPCSVRFCSKQAHARTSGRQGGRQTDSPWPSPFQHKYLPPLSPFPILHPPYGIFENSLSICLYFLCLPLCH